MISPLIWVISIVILPITLLITTQDTPEQSQKAHLAGARPSQGVEVTTGELREGRDLNVLKSTAWRLRVLGLGT